MGRPDDSARLLAGLADDRPGELPDLGRHLAIFGPLAVPARRDRGSWGAQLVEEVEAAGLTGRGGAGFPTGRKLAALRGLRRRPVLVVNSLEGEPASRKDRLLAAVAPHLVLDGAEAAAVALGADRVVVCTPESSPQVALSYRAAAGERMRGGEGSVTMEVHEVSAGYVSGEESALVQWLNGGEALPTFRPSRPAVLELGRAPALVENAETLAHIALVARHGSRWFRSAGVPEAPGTALVTVAGAVASPGVFEVPFGVPVRTILENAGSVDHPAGVLLGGYGGAWLSADQLEIPLLPAPVALAASTWDGHEIRYGAGAGVVSVLPAAACGVAETARVARWLAGESAGQCGPCVFGLPAVADDLEALAFDRSSAEVANRMWHRLSMIARRGACGHPDGAVRLVRSAFIAFAHHVERHLSSGPCPAAEAAPVLPTPRRQTARTVPGPPTGVAGGPRAARSGGIVR